jgi:hypothetical protein
MNANLNIYSFSTDDQLAQINELFGPPPVLPDSESLAAHAEPRRGLRLKHFGYQRRLIRTLRARVPFVVALLLLEMRAELAVRRKLFPKSKA